MLTARTCFHYCTSRKLPKMYCPRCGRQQLVEAAHFCFNCGLSLREVKQLLPDRTSAVAPASNRSDDADSITFPVPTPIEEMEKGMIISTLSKTGGNKTRTAELLRISLKTLHNKLTLYRKQ